MNSTGDGKISPGTIFPWQLAEDNPVISWWGNNLLNKSGGERSYYAGDKLPEYTGEMLQDLLGIWIPLSWGNLSDWTGEWLHWMFGIPPGNNIRSRLPGMLV